MKGRRGTTAFRHQRVPLRFLLIVAAALAAGPASGQDATAVPAIGWEVAGPDLVLRNVPFTLSFSGAGSDTTHLHLVDPARAAAQPEAWQIDDARRGDGKATPVAAGAPPGTILTLAVPSGGLDLAGVCALAGGRPLVVTDGAESIELAPRVVPGWLSVIPPVLAITLALVWRQVIVALLFGVWVAAMVLVGGNPVTAFMRLGDHFLVQALADSSHAAIVVFSTTLSGMVGILAHAGASEGIVRALRSRVGGRRGGQVVTVVMGTVIFFDDYANTLLVGTTMRPLTDRLRISREKLAYLVDSTAAPIATVAVISTWVGFEIGLIQDAMAVNGQTAGTAYTFFLRSLPYGFYPLLTLVFVYLIAATGRDWGPMLVAERRALQEGAVLRPGAEPASANLGGPATEAVPNVYARESDGERDPAAHPALAILPIATVVLVTAGGLIHSGRVGARAAGIPEPSLRQIFDNADSFSVLMWAALSGALLAAVLAIATRRLSLRGAVEGWLDGARAMLVAMVILMLAWALSAASAELHTADYLITVCRELLTARLLPAVTFVLAAAVSFATGTSWGTMAILMPLIYPLGALLPGAEGLDPLLAQRIHLASVSAVLAGAVFGDHCSPISDTTILSSLASGSDHVDHVRTQLPYAVAVALVAMVVGYLPVGFGISPWVSLPVGCLAAAALVFGVARNPRTS